MTVPFPQSDLIRAIRGGADLWDSVQAGVILTEDYFNITPAGIAPSITTQPSNQSAVAGTSASFSVVAAGDPTLTYQWQKYNLKIPTFKGQTNNGDNSFTSSSISAAPPTVAIGDLEIIWCAAGALAPTVAPTFNTPVGWNNGGNGGSIPAVGGVVNTRVHLFWRIAPDTGTSVTLDAGTNCALIYMRESYTNPATINALSQVIFGVDSGGDTSIILPSLTTSSNSLLSVGITQGAAQSITPPPTMTERVDNITYGISAFDEIASGGSTGTRTFTVPTNTDAGWGFAEFLSADPWDNISGAIGSTYTTPILAIGDNLTQYRVIITNSFGSVISSIAVLTVTGSGPTQRVKYWNGSTWITGTLKYWNGSAWTIKPLKYWNGSTWI